MVKPSLNRESPPLLREKGLSAHQSANVEGASLTALVLGYNPRKQVVLYLFVSFCIFQQTGMLVVPGECTGLVIF